MNEQLKSAIIEAHGRGDIQEALRLLKTAVAQGDEQAKRAYDQLVEIGGKLPTPSAVIEIPAVTHYLCISPPSTFDEWKITKRGPLEVVLHPTHGRKVWEPSIGIAPESNKISVAVFENDESANIEPPLASLGLGRSSGHSFFVRWVTVDDPPRRAVRFILGVAYRSPQMSITHGEVPAMFLNPKNDKKHFWQFWK
jgi:hypothetical protein